MERNFSLYFLKFIGCLCSLNWFSYPILWLFIDNYQWLICQGREKFVSSEIGLEIKCEGLCFTSIRNGGNGGNIREGIHISIVFKDFFDGNVISKSLRDRGRLAHRITFC